MKILFTTVFLPLFLMHANVLETTEQTIIQTNQAAALSQQNIDRMDDAAQKNYAEYKSLLAKIESMKLYVGQLEKLEASQKEEVVSLEEQILEIGETQQEVLPLMQEMAETYARFVESDMPFQQKERGEKAAKLLAILERADISASEKYRRIMEAYQVEYDYARTLEAYRGELVDGTVVDFLRVGRVGLYYQSLDGKNSGYYDLDSNSFKTLPLQKNRAIKQALRIARKQSAPDVLVLPVRAPEVVR